MTIRTSENIKFTIYWAKAIVINITSIYSFMLILSP